MTERKWTKGPWVVEMGMLRQPNNRRPIEVSGLCMAHFSKGTGSASSEANANLIAAAPELYEALEGLARQMDYMARIAGTTMANNAGYQRAKTALAKARGETK